MNDYGIAKKIIKVTGDEAKLVQAAQAVEINAERRAKSEAPKGAIAPMTFYETEQERTIIAEFRQLCKRYQTAYGLALPPLLVPSMSYAPAQPPSVDAPPPYLRHALTDMELAKLLLQRVVLRRRGETLYRFNGIYYERLTMDKFHTMIYGELREELSVNGSSRQIKSVAAAIMAEPTIEITDSENVVSGLCLQNGVLDLSTFSLYEHSSRYFFTWKLPVSWYGPQECPMFDQFLETVSGGDRLLIQRFWEAIAYVLVPNDNRAKRFLIMIGLGDTGKSVLGELLRAFFEPEAVGSVDIFRMGDRFSLSTLVYKQINISMDLSDTALNEQAVSIIKQITGRDLVQVEEKYKTPYAARINCKLIFGTNHALRINSQDRAFVRRCLYLPFDYPIPIEKQDRFLLNKLLSERSGILYKALLSYRALVARGYVFSGDDIYDMGRAYQPAEQVADQLDTLEQFVQQHCAEETDSFVTTDVLYESYLLFCESLQRESIRNKQVFSAKFNSVIKCCPKVALSKKRVDGVPCNGYKGLLLY